MINPRLLAKSSVYLERHCLDQRWFDYRKRLGRPVDLYKVESLKNVIGQLEYNEGRTPESYKWLVAHVKNVQEDGDRFPVRLGKEPPPITDTERARTLETHRNYFANYLFDLMEQKNFTDAEVAARARVDAAIFTLLRNNKRYIPEERTAFALLFGLELTLAEANALLGRTRIYLSEKVWEEVLIGFCLENHIYNLATVDKVFKHYGLAPLRVTEDFSERLKEKPPRDNVLIDRIDLYLEKNFSDTSGFEAAAKRGIKVSYSARSLGEPEESLKTFEVIIRKLKDKIGLAGSFFSDYLFKLIKQKNLSEVDVYKRAHLDRRVFSKIRNERNYMPAKKTVLAIAFAMKLDFKETNTLLARAGYFLSSGRKEDVIAAYFIDNQIYDLFLINEVLDYYDCPILGG